MLDWGVEGPQEGGGGGAEAVEPGVDDGAFADEGSEDAAFGASAGADGYN